MNAPQSAAAIRHTEAVALDALLAEVAIAYRHLASFTPDAVMSFRRALKFYKLPGGRADPDAPAASLQMIYPAPTPGPARSRAPGEAEAFRALIS